METTKKTCFKCQESKPLSEFYRHSKMGDGHLNKCKECTKKDTKQTRAANRDYYTEYDRNRSKLPHRIENAKSHSLEWKKDYPDRRRAQVLLGNAIKSKKIEKQPCFVCGGNRVEAHHPVYSMPLDVVWLCPHHHKMTHAMANEYLKAA